ncbi:GIY-YIG nuclease family protein [Paenibacillus sp. GCM10023252]|uniref:GIY-YIG nuclease family protein n=1 Tax=Paenibacillus sp. GCM10023252 TaxID=3252649 RepID=UPI0036117114
MTAPASLNDKHYRKQLTQHYQQQEREMGVYEIRNHIDGRRYIASSTNLAAIWTREQFTLNLGTHSNRALQADWSAYGGAAFTFSILEKLKLEDKPRFDYRDLLQPTSGSSATAAKSYERAVKELAHSWKQNAADSELPALYN